MIATPIGPNFAFDIADDGALIWLKDNSGTKTADAVAALNAFSVHNDTGIVEWLSGPLLTLPYQDPAHDSRTPDIIGIAEVGVIYTSGSKIAEHGGFNEDDTHVALIVSHPDFEKETVNAAVATAHRADHPEGARLRSQRARGGAAGEHARAAGFQLRNTNNAGGARRSPRTCQRLGSWFLSLCQSSSPRRAKRRIRCAG